MPIKAYMSAVTLYVLSVYKPGTGGRSQKEIYRWYLQGRGSLSYNKSNTTNTMRARKGVNNSDNTERKFLLLSNHAAIREVRVCIQGKGRTDLFDIRMRVFIQKC